MNQEAHGQPVARATLEAFHLPAWLIDQMQIDGLYYHPTFLYESLLCLLGVGILLALREWAPLRLGDALSFYGIWYGTSRFVVEGMRTDSLYIFSTIRVSQALSLVFILMGIFYSFYRYHHKDRYIYYRDIHRPMNLAVL